MSVEMWVGIIVIGIFVVLGTKMLNQRNAGDSVDQVNAELVGIYRSEKAAGNLRYGVKDISYKGIHLGSTVADLLAALPGPADVEDRTVNQKDGSHVRGVKYFDVVHPEPPLDHVFFAFLDDHAYSITLEYDNPGHYLDVGGAYGVVEALDSKYGQHDSSSGGEWGQLWSWGVPRSHVMLQVSKMAGGRPGVMFLTVKVEDSRMDMAVMNRPRIAGRPASPEKTRNLGF